MFNPFTEVAEGDPTDAELVEKAKSGLRAALESLVLRHQAWIYNIAVCMVLRRRPDAITGSASRGVVSAPGVKLFY
jgi:hypothetical protein